MTGGRPIPRGRPPAGLTPRIPALARPGLIALGAFFLSAGLAGCGKEGTPETRQLAGTPELREPAGLQEVTGVAVEGWEGPGGSAFEARARRGAIESYPCTSCHVGEPGAATPAPGARADDAHRNIELLHPLGAGGECTTCHVEGRPDSLALQGRGAPVPLDHAYALCANCHFSETRAWAGGAHGKRVEGWVGRRVVYNCADCHNPHAPAFDRRIPFPGPRIP